MTLPRGFRDLKAYQLAYDLAMDIFRESMHFPGEEKYSLTDQIRRASRSVAANIAEGYQKSGIRECSSARWPTRMEKRRRPKYGWILLADCGYMSPQVQAKLTAGYEELGRMLGGMIHRPERFSV
jgi:hypothetical protein